MQKSKRTAVLAMCITAISAGTALASPLSLPSSDSHPIYFDAQNYRQSSAEALKGVFTEKHLDKLASPSKEALAATAEDAEDVRESLKLPEELYLLPLTEKGFLKSEDSEKQAFIEKHYKSFISKTNKLIKDSGNADEKAFYGAAQKLVRDYVSNDAMRADGKASVSEWFDTHVEKVEAGAAAHADFQQKVRDFAETLQPE